MNWRKFFIAFIAAFVFIFVFGFIWYAKLMHGAHMEVPALFRPEAEFQGNFPILVLGQLVLAFFFTLIFVRGFGSGGGIAGGFRYGILLGLLVCGANLIRYAVEPLTTTILIGWCIGEIVEFTIAGAIVGAIYKPSASVV
jgi:hypothetical protein